MNTNKYMFKEIESDHVSHTSSALDSGECSLKNRFEGLNDENFGTGSPSRTFKKRPTNLQGFISSEKNLTCDTTEANFSLKDISDNEEIWVFDVPKTIDPKNLKGQTIKLGKKNNLHIGRDLYETSYIEKNDEQHLSLVFNTGKLKHPYKMVNVKPVGAVRIRQKLSKVLNAHLVSPKKACVPFPKNLKLRHPLFGHDYNEKLITVDE